MTEFIMEISPVVHEVACLGVEMTENDYREWKAVTKARIDGSCLWIKRFFEDMFVLIESYRYENRQEATTCKE